MQMKRVSSYTKDITRKYKGLTLDEAYIAMLVFAGTTIGEAREVVMQSDITADAPINEQLIKQVVKDLKQPLADAKKDIARLNKLKRAQDRELKEKRPKFFSRDILISKLQQLVDETDGKDRAGIVMKLAQMLGYDEPKKEDNPNDRIIFYLPKPPTSC